MVNVFLLANTRILLKIIFLKVNVTFTIRKQVQSWSQFAKKKIIKKFAKSMQLSKQGLIINKYLVKK